MLEIGASLVLAVHGLLLLPFGVHLVISEKLSWFSISWCLRQFIIETFLGPKELPGDQESLVFDRLTFIVEKASFLMHMECGTCIATVSENMDFLRTVVSAIHSVFWTEVPAGGLLP